MEINVCSGCGRIIDPSVATGFRVYEKNLYSFRVVCSLRCLLLKGRRAA